MTALAVRVVSAHDISAADLARWRALVDRAAVPNAFVDPRFLAHQKVVDPNREREVSLLFVERGGEFDLVVPLRRYPRLGRLPLKFATTFRAGFDVAYPLVDAARPVEAFAGAFRWARRAGLPPIIEFSLLPDGLVGDAVQAAASTASTPLFARARHERAFVSASRPHDATAGEFQLPHMSASRRKSLRRSARKLADAWGEAPEVVELDDKDIVDDFVRIQATGWKGDRHRGGDGLSLRAGRVERFRRIVEAFRKDGDLRVTGLAGGGNLAYVAITLRQNNSWFGLTDAYDDAWSGYSAGTLGRVGEIQRFHRSEDRGFFDPCFDAGYAESTAVFPDRRASSDVLAAVGGWMSRAAVRSAPQIQRLRNRRADVRGRRRP